MGVRGKDIILSDDKDLVTQASIPGLMTTSLTLALYACLEQGYVNHVASAVAT